MTDDTSEREDEAADTPQDHADIGFKDLSEDWRRQVRADERENRRRLKRKRREG